MMTATVKTRRLCLALHTSMPAATSAANGADCQSKGRDGGGKNKGDHAGRFKSGSGGGRFAGNFSYCSKPGHKKIDCFEGKKDKGEKVSHASDGKDETADGMLTAIDASDDKE
jgi:hypothetical protein